VYFKRTLGETEPVPVSDLIIMPVQLVFNSTQSLERFYQTNNGKKNWTNTTNCVLIEPSNQNTITYKENHLLPEELKFNCVIHPT
jgi:hypothetical protein